MRTIDRYVLRETLAPFALALLVLTFILIIPFIIAQAETMIAKGVPWLTVAQVMVTLLPQALGLTIPMALLVIVGFKHALDGVKVFIDDYVHEPGSNFVINTLLLFAAIGGASIALYALAALAFGGAQ